MDPKISFVPKSIIDWAMKKTLKELINNILKYLKKFKGSKWEKKLKHGPNKPFYHWAENIFKDFVEKNKHKL